MEACPPLPMSHIPSRLHFLVLLLLQVDACKALLLLINSLVSDADLLSSSTLFTLHPLLQTTVSLPSHLFFVLSMFLPLSNPPFYPQAGS